MRRKKLLMITLTLALFSMLLSPAPVHADTITVSNTNDSGAGSLREAINQANANAGPDTIRFNISGCGGVCTIQLNNPLPPLTDDATTIDGYSQPGAVPAASSNPATILIMIDGTHAGANAIGLAITSAENEIRGLAITHFTWDGIAIGTIDAINNVVAGNYLGIDPAGNAAGNGHSGVFIGLGAHRNTIGGEHAADRNVLSGNAWSGVELHGADTQLNLIGGNYIGISPTGNASVPNSLFGVRIYGGAAGNIIGGYRNLISGNEQHGVTIEGVGTDQNIISDNYIGTTADGMSALGNDGNGVNIVNGPQDNHINGNVIADNDYGVVILSAHDLTERTLGNEVLDNAIGVAADGITPLGNAQSGVWISFLGQGTTVGVNIIAHNGADGVHVDTPTAFNNYIWMNSIHDNGGLGIRLTNGANGGILPPIINEVNLSERVVSGAACPFCTVQVFANPNDDGEGQTFIGQADAGPAGDFDVTFTSLPSGYLTATATMIYTDEGTSTFSPVYEVTFLLYLPLILSPSP
jgi:hypothetical protein